MEQFKSKSTNENKTRFIPYFINYNKDLFVGFAELKLLEGTNKLNQIRLSNRIAKKGTSEQVYKLLESGKITSKIAQQILIERLKIEEDLDKMFNLISKETLIPSVETNLVHELIYCTVIKNISTVSLETLIDNVKKIINTGVFKRNAKAQDMFVSFMVWTNEYGLIKETLLSSTLKLTKIQEQDLIEETTAYFELFNDEKMLVNEMMELINKRDWVSEGKRDFLIEQTILPNGNYQEYYILLKGDKIKDLNLYRKIMDKVVKDKSVSINAILTLIGANIEQFKIAYGISVVIGTFYSLNHISKRFVEDANRDQMVYLFQELPLMNYDLKNIFKYSNEQPIIQLIKKLCIKADKEQLRHIMNLPNMKGLEKTFEFSIKLKESAEE